MLPNILQWTGESLTMRNYPDPNICGAKVEKPSSNVIPQSIMAAFPTQSSHYCFYTRTPWDVSCVSHHQLTTEWRRYLWVPNCNLNSIVELQVHTINTTTHSLMENTETTSTMPPIWLACGNQSFSLSYSQMIWLY